MTIAQHPLRVSAIYNPQTQSRTELIQGFVARQKIFKRLFKSIKEAKMDTPEQHYLLLARRGMGKTTLLLRLAYEIENDETLHSWLEPLVFNEEEYGIRRLFNFWERTLELLAARIPDFSFTDVDRRRLSTLYTDDESYERALYDLLLQTLQQSHKKIILFIDNFGDLSRKFSGDEAHRLRKILQTCADIRIFAASAVVLDELYDYGHPFYEFFKVEELKGLDQKETQALLLSLSKHYKQEQVERIVREHPGRVEALRRVTGGVIRTMVLLFEIFADDNDGSAFKDLEGVLDRITPLYKHRMDDLSDQQQAIVEAIALHWDGIHVKEIADRTRLDSKIISAQLQQLERNGVVEKRPTNTKNHLYLISERFFNIWFLMRLGRRGDEKRILWLVRFLESWCDNDMMKNRAEGHRKALLKGNFDPEAAFAYTQAFAQSQKLSLGDRHELLRDTKTYLADTAPDIAPDLPASELDEAWKALKEWFEGDTSGLVQLFYLHDSDDDDTKLQFQKAIKDGDLNYINQSMIKSALVIGNIYSSLKVPEWDKALKAWTWVQNTGNSTGSRLIAGYYRSISENKKAMEFYEKAAQNGDTDSMNDLGVLYSISKNIDKAKSCYLEAANAGNTLAMQNFAALLEKEGNIEVALKWLEKAAFIGDGDGMHFFARLLEVHSHDIENATKWYEKSAETGNSDSMINLGTINHRLGNFDTAKKWYEKAANAGHIQVSRNMGILQETVYKDIKSAMLWYEKAANLGNSDAMNNLALIYQNELDNFFDAKKWYEKAAALNNVNSMLFLGLLLENTFKDYSQAQIWYENAANLGSSDAMYNLSNLYDNRLNDKIQAQIWLNKAANAGNSYAMNNLCWLYFEQKDKISALHWLQQWQLSKSDNDWHRHTMTCIYLWNNEFDEAKVLAEQFLQNNELLNNTGDDMITFFALALAKGLSPWLLNYFLSPEGEAVQLKDRFKPIYYALLKATDHPDYLRMGDELRQTVEEIEIRVQQMVKEYA